MIEERLKERLVGAVVLTAVAVSFIPMVFEGGPKSQQAPVTKSQEDFTSSSLAAEDPSPPLDVVEAEPASRPISTTHRPPQAADQSSPKPPQAKTLWDRSPADATRTGWVVQLASFSREANAKTLRAKLVAQGFAAFIEKTSSVYRVRVGPTSGQQQARDLRAALKLAVNLHGVVVRYP
ncbi:MAG: SPOR domain-containing protein [Gammaproteobacteria bacterium]